MKNRLKGNLIGVLLVSISLFFYSFHTVSIRYLTSELLISPGILVFFRFFIGGLFLIFFGILFSKKGEIINFFKEKKEKNIFLNIYFWSSIISLVLTLILFHYSLQFTSASNGILIQTLSPVLVVIFSMILLKNKIVNYRKIFFAVLIASIGSSLLLNDFSFNNNSENIKILGDGIVFLSAITLALFNIFNVELRKKFPNKNGLLITSFTLLLGGIITLPFFIYSYGSLFPLTEIKINLILLISIGSTGIAFLCRFLAAKYFSAILLAFLTNIIGVTTIIVEYYVFNEVREITYKLVIGALLIILGSIYINVVSYEKNKPLTK